MSSIFPKFTEDVPPLLTDATLERYAAFVASSCAKENAASPSAAQKSDGGNSVDHPSTAEEALAPLELLYGKTFVHALAIALHGAEAVTCYIEKDSAIRSQSCDGTSDTAALVRPMRRLYRVGEHVLLSPYYCPCSAYTYQSIRRQEVWCCKHLLALQILLKLESFGIQQANIVTREVDTATFGELSMESFQKVK